MPDWELVELIPGGNWAIAAVGLLAVPGVRKHLRPVAGAVVRSGLGLVGHVTRIVVETRENAEDLVGEVRAGSASPGVEHRPKAKERAGARRSSSEAEPEAVG